MTCLINLKTNHTALKKIVTTLIILTSALLFSCAPSSDKNSPAEQSAYLVRHAEKVLDNTKNPDLTEQGKQRAEKLADLLADANIKAIFSSDYTRTIMTGKPLADLQDVKIQIYEAHDFGTILTYLSENPQNNILVVGHSNTIPQLANTLIKKESYSELNEDTYSTLFQLSRKGKNWTCQILEF